jgi:hypothetical protein
MGSCGKWDDYDLALTIIVIIKQEIFKCIKCTNKRDEMYDFPPIP